MNEQVTQTEPTVNLTLTATQFNVVMTGLNELPFKLVGNLIPELVKQVQAQVQQAQSAEMRPEPVEVKRAAKK